MAKKQITIPVFVPEEACPNRCIYCNQFVISGTPAYPTEKEIVKTIETYCSTIKDSTYVELGFFGGNFTGIPIEQMEGLLKIVNPYIQKGIIKSVRVSTRPDYIDDERITMLKHYGVKTIELGVQSMNDHILEYAGRGHTANDVRIASKMIKGYDLRLGLQMMIGLPFDTFADNLATARAFLELLCDDVGIYPVIILKNTILHHYYSKGEYFPLSVEEAAARTAAVMKIFIENHVTIIRVGLHPSKEITQGEAFVAGPFHPSFRHIAMTKVWENLLRDKIKERGERVEIFCAPSEISNAVGYMQHNKQWLKEIFKNVVFTADSSQSNLSCYVIYH
jgi:radical SAM enzyme (TIGR01210 family)